MPDEHDLSAMAALDAVLADSGVVPPMFRVEVGNALLIAQRRKRITSDFLKLALRRISLLPLEDDRESPEHLWSTTIEIAASYDLTLYDATYLESALRLDLPLATLDAKLGHAAELAGVSFPTPPIRN